MTTDLCVQWRKLRSHTGGEGPGQQARWLRVILHEDEELVEADP